MLAKWSPFNGRVERSSSALPAFSALFQEADALLRSAVDGDLAPLADWSAAVNPVPAADMLDAEDEIQLKIDLPGHDVKSLQITLEGDTLTVRSERKRKAHPRGVLRAERAHGLFARSFVVPDTVDPDRCEAHFDNGVLTISLPKREEARPRTIDIKVNG